MKKGLVIFTQPDQDMREARMIFHDVFSEKSQAGFEGELSRWITLAEFFWGWSGSGKQCESL